MLTPRGAGSAHGQGGWFDGAGAHVSFPSVAGAVDSVSIRLWMRAFSVDGTRPILSTMCGSDDISARLTDADSDAGSDAGSVYTAACPRVLEREV